jgi:hypothetical protein
MAVGSLLVPAFLRLISGRVFTREIMMSKHGGDMAPWRHDSSADPGTKTEGGGTMPPCLTLRDWYECSKSGHPVRKITTTYRVTPVSPFHIEPLQL